MRWMGVINLLLVAMILGALALLVLSPKEQETFVFNRPAISKELPKSPFSEAELFFQEAENSLFSLESASFQMQLPDLRSVLLFLGKNERPDALRGKAGFLFSLRGSEEYAQAGSGEKIYLVYKGGYKPKGPLMQGEPSLSCRPIWGDPGGGQQEGKSLYAFSPENRPTSLWFVPQQFADQKVKINVHLIDERGTVLSDPQELHSFHLTQMDGARGAPQVWEVGGHRADPTLLVRQKARWIGRDLFLQEHGGEDFAFATGKERIDFVDGLESYSCFVGPGDFLVWEECRWAAAQETQNKDLLYVKKIEDKLISFELWNKEGIAKLPLTLLRSKDSLPLPDLTQEFKFVGAKTWGQFIVEVRREGRMILRPNEWLVLTPDGWTKLDSADKIDAYVDQSLAGPLFILEKMSKKNGKQVLIGQLFNASRTEMQSIELPSSSSSPLANHYRHIPQVPPAYSKPNEWMEESR